MKYWDGRSDGDELELVPAEQPSPGYGARDAHVAHGSAF